MFRALVERCPMVSYACDEQNRIVYISPQIEAWTGLPAQHVDRGPDALAPDAPPGRPRARRQRGLRRRGARHRVPDARPRREVDVGVGARGQGRGPRPAARASASTSRRCARRARRCEAARSQLSAVVNAAPVILFATDADGHDHALRGQGAALARPLEPGEMVGQSIFPGRPRAETLQAHARRALAGESFDTPRRRSATGTYDCTWHAAGGRLDHRHRDRRDGAPPLRGAARPSRLPRPAHRPAEPLDARGAPRPRPGPRPARGRHGRRPLHRPRPLQARQRLARARRRRPASCAEVARADQRRSPAAATCSPGSAATSSCSSAPA